MLQPEVSWKGAMRNVLQSLPERFTLDDIRPFHAELERLFPRNMHVAAKVRQTLQLLRDRGELEFLGNGRYRKLNVQPRFSCLLDTALGSAYKSRSQFARVVIEPWAELNLYCLECPSDDISALPNNTKVADLHCPRCKANYQVKSREGRFNNRIQGGEFKTYIAAVETGTFPNLVLVEWDRRFSSVVVVQAINGGSIKKDRIIGRNQLSATARRAGYQGCTIDIIDLKRVDLVAPNLRDPDACRDAWREAFRACL